MKKLLTTIFVLCFGLSVMAAEPAAEQWNAMDLGFWFGVPASMKTANVHGWRIGWPICAGEGTVRGFESGIFCAATDNIEGFQMSFGVTRAKELTGLQMAIVNICCNEVVGSQIGVVNVAGKRGWQIGLVNTSTNAKLQLGLINVNKDGLMPFSIILNLGRDTFK